MIQYKCTSAFKSRLSHNGSLRYSNGTTVPRYEMTTIDQFSSVFRSAVKPNYPYQSVNIDQVLIVTDLNQAAAREFGKQVQDLLAPQQVSGWETISGDQYSNTLELLGLLEGRTPDLICCYRNLHSQAWQYPHSLGSHLDVLIQKTSSPVLILPHPEAGYAYARAYDSRRKVIAMTDHMTNDDMLVSYAAEFAKSDGHLHLAHIEDEATFSRYIEAISKIETIDTENAEATIKHQLLKYPNDYIESCRTVLAEKYPSVTVNGIVTFGERPADYLNYVDEFQANLLLMHGKDEDRLAMPAASYPLAVELRQIPVLII